MDSFEFNKVVAAILIALLTVKGASLISESLIHPQMLKENVFKIAGVETTQTADGGSAQPKGPAPIEPLLASASAEKGAQVFKSAQAAIPLRRGVPIGWGRTFIILSGRKELIILAMLILKRWSKKAAVGAMMT